MFEVATEARESTMMQFPKENKDKTKADKNSPLNHRNPGKNRIPLKIGFCIISVAAFFSSWYLVFFQIRVRRDEDSHCFSKSRLFNPALFIFLLLFISSPACCVSRCIWSAELLQMLLHCLVFRWKILQSLCCWESKDFFGCKWGG